jgi:dolichyl-phosphate beta-glucosyltransferase
MSIPAQTFIVVPCYNEAERLAADEFERAARAHPTLHFVLVDDGSKDRTREILTELSARLPARIHALSLERNSGKAEAVRRGVLDALERGASLVGYWDADLATPLAAIPAFAQVLSDRPEIELVLGARVKLLGRHVERQPSRHYIGRVFATLASMALKLPVYDTQCGAKLMRTTPEVRQAFAEPFTLNWCFDVELIARLKRAHGAAAGEFHNLCVELPLDTWTDAPGSKLTLWHAPKIAGELAKLFWLTRK